MEELFEVEESKSPKKLWMEKHDVQTKVNLNIDADLGQYEAWVGNYEDASDKQMSYFEDLDGPYFSAADSHDKALWQLAQANKWRLWNEEG